MYCRVQPFFVLTSPAKVDDGTAHITESSATESPLKPILKDKDKGKEKEDTTRKRRKLGTTKQCMQGLTCPGPLEYRISTYQEFFQRVAQVTNNQCNVVSKKQPAVAEASILFHWLY